MEIVPMSNGRYLMKFTKTTINTESLEQRRLISLDLDKQNKPDISNKPKVNSRRTLTLILDDTHSPTLLNNTRPKKNRYNKFAYSDYVMPSGKVVRVQGYEPYALDILLKTYSEDQIVVGDRTKTPNIYWIDSNKQFRKYYVDIFIPSENKLIEVKGTGTFYQLEDCEKKIKVPTECTRCGYNYEYWVFDFNRNRTVFSGFTTDIRSNIDILAPLEDDCDE